MNFSLNCKQARIHHSSLDGAVGGIFYTFYMFYTAITFPLIATPQLFF